jgi:riboflavin biosynthesis pyrimidine reductase
MVSVRPLVAVSLAGSFTGRIWHPDQPILGGARDRYRLEWLRCQADLLLYGAGTARVDQRQIRIKDPGLAAKYRLRDRGTVPPIAIVANSANFDWKSPFWRTPTPMTLVLPEASEDHRVPDSIDILRVSDTADLETILGRLAERHGNRILCEGGGRLYSALCRLGLVDELFYTVTSWSLGSDLPAMAPEPLPLQCFALVSAEVTDQEVLLRYRTPAGRAWTQQADLDPPAETS